MPPGQSESPDDGYWLGLLEGTGSFPNVDPVTGLIDPDAQPSVHNESDHDFWLFETQSTGSAEHFIDIAFENIHGDLDAQLYQFIPQTGWLIVDTASTSNNIESLSLDGLQGGLFCLEVFGFSGDTNTYAINWNTPVHTPMGDIYEPNDVTPTDFTDLPQVIDLYGVTLHTINDVDNYLIQLNSTGQPGNEVYIRNETIDEGSALTATLQPVNTNSGEVIEGIELGWGESVISFAGLPAGQYVLTISAPANATPENWASAGIQYGMYGILPSLPINDINADIFEVNNTPETATDLRDTYSERIDGLTIHNRYDDDFFKFQLTNAATQTDSVKVFFEHELGDIDAKLYRMESGNLEPLAESEGDRDSETLSLAGLQAGEYYVKVYGHAGATNTYALQFDINTSSLTPDRFEVNDTFQTATQLRELSGFTVYEQLGFHASADEDWFAFETVSTSNQSNYVSALDHGQNGGINLELFDRSGNPIAQDGEYLQLHNLPASQYYLKVTPSLLDQHTYDLVIDAPVLSQSPGDPNRGDWTIMVYITASDLYRFAQSDVNEIEKAVSELPGTVNVTVLWDQSELGMTYATDSGRQAPWGGAGQAVITADRDMASIRTRFDLLGEKNTGDPSTLVDFVTWSKDTAPADKYGLILWDHGAGLDGFNYDNHDPGPSDYLTTQELATAMTGLSQTGPAVDLLSFDACLMSMAEVGYELRNGTEVFVSSQEVVGGDGHNYTTLFDTLKQNPGSVTAEELGAGFVRSFGDFYTGFRNWDTHSAIRTSGFESLTNALGQLTAAVSNADHESQRIVSSTIGHTHSFFYEDLRDLGGFVERLANHNSLSPPIRDAAATVLDTLQSMVISRTADQRDSSGLSIFLPTANQTMQNWYATDYASFNAATNWNSMLSTLRSSGNTNYTQADWLQGGRSALTAFDLGVVAGTGTSFNNLSLFDSQDSDWMKFEVRGGGTTGGAFGISVDSSSESTFSATLYDASGNNAGSLNDGRMKLDTFADGIYTLHVSADGDVSDYRVTIDAPDLAAFRGRVIGNNDSPDKATDWGVINGAQIEPGLTLPSRSFSSDNDGWKYFEFQTPRLPGITDWSFSVNTPQNTSVTAQLFEKENDSLVEMVTETGSGSLPFSYTSFGESEQYVLRVRQSQSTPSEAAFQVQFYGNGTQEFIQPIERTGDQRLGQNREGFAFSNTTPINYGNSPLEVSFTNTWQIVDAETVNGKNYVFAADGQETPRYRMLADSTWAIAGMESIGNATSTSLPPRLQVNENLELLAGSQLLRTADGGTIHSEVETDWIASALANITIRENDIETLQNQLLIQNKFDQAMVRIWIFDDGWRFERELSTEELPDPGQIESDFQIQLP